jgi:ADP-ribose pyrophosphatase YjhB (NUDIX family)
MDNKITPLVVAISALIHNNKILLIKRAKGNLQGMWGLPGGKMEAGEHLSDAAIREIYEETGIRSSFNCHLGFVSEHLIEQGQIYAHLALHVCELIPAHLNISSTREGDLEWFDLDALEDKKEIIIPSDFYIIEKLVKKREKNYYNSVIEKKGEKHVLKKFD